MTLAALVHARDALEGGSRPDADTYLILSLLLLKIASDATYYGNPAIPYTPGEPLRCVPYCVPPQARFDTLFRQRHAEGNGLRVMNALRVFTLGNPRKLGGLFPTLKLEDALPADPSVRNAALLQVLERLSLPALDFRQQRGITRPDVGDAVDVLLDRQVPPALTWLMAALTHPYADEAVYDPSCRQGAVLRAAANWMRDEESAKAPAGPARYPLYGQEPDPMQCAVARLRLLLQGADTPRLYNRDPLEEPLLQDGALQRFHVALACPPLSLKWAPSHAAQDPHFRFLQGIPSRQWAHTALIQHMLATLDPGCGRMAIVVPHGVLFRDGEESRIRQAWLDENLVDTVIGLPDRLFAGASVATALLVLRRVRRNDAVLFIDARGLASRGKRGPRLGMDAARSLRRLCVERRSVPGVAHLAGSEELAVNGGNLSVARYVQPASQRPPADIATLRAQRAELSARFVALQAALNAELDALEGELSDLV
ncbi:N-6 DNA methylase [Stenotrophomonas sp. ISL-67]|uniref:HsdM family class I SAM-dependent methyltransferase n=1 Tax=Stenotrophomonas sp. ISL-67 TaxID=2819171 RepID=UPI001BEA5C75|nr:N-6 DNA methylase [Stenotrophomonas sp. ISL-67]MBT2767145.1 N-6 DNA methylase [Stenotrophomonas sp. ISL-67]